MYEAGVERRAERFRTTFDEDGFHPSSAEFLHDFAQRFVVKNAGPL